MHDLLRENSLVCGTKIIHIKQQKERVMEKSKFERFISKYNLGGTCESVTYIVAGSLASTRAISDDKNVLCEVSGPSFGFSEGSYAVYDTTKLRSLLGVLGENLTVTAKKSSDKVIGVTFNDGSTDATFVLADESVIPSVPELKKLPPFEMELSMNEHFVTTFIKAKSALSEVETFTVTSTGEGNTADVILGYSSMNTNRVTIKADTQSPVSLSPIAFSAKYLREILVANKDAKGGTLEISSKGLARTSFTVDNIKSTYYLVQIDTKE